MMLRSLSRLTVTAAAAGIMLVGPRAAEAQPACVSGPLSAYLAAAGVGCKIGNLTMKGFAQTNMGGVLSSVIVNPFTMVGPPGFTWIGFTLGLTGVALPSEGRVSFSFMSAGGPLFGLLAQSNILGTGALRTDGLLTGDGGGAYSAMDRFINAVRTLQGCEVNVSCINGQSFWTSNTALGDADNIYDVLAKQRWELNGGPNDLTIAVLAQNTVTPEPASMALLSTGLTGLGVAIRRRRKNQASA